MIEATIIIIAVMVFFLVNKWLEQRQQEIDYREEVNKEAAEAALLAALEERLKPFNIRINDTWSIVSHLKEEINSLRLQYGLKGK